MTKTLNNTNKDVHKFFKKSIPNYSYSFSYLALICLSSIFLEILPLTSTHFFHPSTSSNLVKPISCIIFYILSKSLSSLALYRINLLKLPVVISDFSRGKANIKICASLDFIVYRGNAYFNYGQYLLIKISISINIVE